MDIANSGLGARLYPVGFLLFLAATAFLPLGLGGNRPLPFGLFQIAISLSALSLLFTKEHWAKLIWPKHVVAAVACFLVIAVWSMLQALPVMPDFIAHPFWQETAAALGHKVNGSIALDRDATWHHLSRYVTYLLAGVLAYIYGQNPAQARQMLMTILGVGAAIACYAIILRIADVQKILWLPKWAHQHDMTGTFVNRNHFAVYAGIMLVCAFGLLWQSARQHFKDTPRHAISPALQEFLRNDFWRFGSLCIIFIFAVIFSHSRAGLVASLFGIIIFSGCYLFYQKRRIAAIALPLALLAICTVFFFTIGHSMGRFASLFTDYSSTDRLKVYAATWDAIMNSPLWGYGLGNFETVFRLFRGEEIGMNFNRAHSDWLESLFDLGIPFGLLLWAGIAVLLFTCLRGIAIRRQNGLYPALALGTSAVLLPHAAVEFGLQMPGLVIVWIVLLAVGVAQSQSSRERA